MEDGNIASAMLPGKLVIFKRIMEDDGGSFDGHPLRHFNDLALSLRLLPRPRRCTVSGFCADRASICSFDGRLGLVSLFRRQIVEVQFGRFD